MSCLRCLFVLILCALLTACGEPGDDAESQTTGPSDTRPQETDDGSLANTDGTDTPGDESNREAPADATGQATPESPEGHVIGPAIMTGTATINDDSSAAYKISLLGELGLPLVNWRHNLRDREAKMELYNAPVTRIPQPILSVMAQVSRQGGQIIARGQLYDADNTQFDFEVAFEIEGYVAPEPGSEPAPTQSSADRPHPLADLLDDGVHTTPSSIRQLFAAVPVPTIESRLWLTSISEDEDAPSFFSCTAVLPAAESVTYEFRMFSGNSWSQVAVATCDHEGNLLFYGYDSGMPDEYRIVGRTEPLPDSAGLLFSEYFQSSEDDRPGFQQDIDINPLQMRALPLPLEMLAFDYHIAQGHERFLIETSDYTSNAGVVNYALYERMPDETIEIGGESITAHAYRHSMTSVPTTDSIRGDHFGEIVTYTLYTLPDGTWLRVTGEGLVVEETTLDAAVEALGLTEAELLRPVPEIEE